MKLPTARNTLLLYCLLSAVLLLSISCSQNNREPLQEPTIDRSSSSTDSETPVVSPVPAEVEMPAPIPELQTPISKPAPAAAPNIASHLALQKDGTALMKPGQSVTLSPSMSLHYLRVVSDSRCPQGAQCIWAGEVTVELTLHSGSEQNNFTLTSNSKRSATVLGMQVELVSIDRANRASFRVKKS